MHSMGIDEEAFKIALKEITKLNPKPGNGWDGSISSRNARLYRRYEQRRIDAHHE